MKIFANIIMRTKRCFFGLLTTNSRQCSKNRISANPILTG
jgi:hypothetical protein